MFTTADALDAEWEYLQDTPVEWTDCPELLHAVSPADALALIPSFSDPILAYLIARAQAGDDLAGRTIIQAFIGKLVNMAIPARNRGVPDAFDDCLATLWLTIARYRLDRRPTKIPANLAMDTLRDTLKGWIAASPKNQEVLSGVSYEWITDDRAESAGQPHEPWLTAQELIELAGQREWITPGMADILARVYAQGLSGVQTAQLRGCAPATVRSQCRNGIAKIRSHADEILACWG